MQKTIKIIIITFIFSLFAACKNDNSAYRQNIKISDSGWVIDSIATFPVNIIDSAKFYDIYLNVRNTNNYKYANLYLFVRTTSPQGNYVIDTVEYAIADEYGKWTGKRLSRIWDNHFPYRGSIKFAGAGNYTISIQQGMRDTMLVGINDIGIEIKESEK